MKVFIVVTVFVVLAALHQDCWNWDKEDLVLGFMPEGLAYHAGYSLIAAIYWALVVRFAWPGGLEEWAAQGDDRETGKEPR